MKRRIAGILLTLVFLSVGLGSSAAQQPARTPADLLQLDDAALLTAVARPTFDYFWQETNPANGLIKDRSTADSPASIAAVGFGLAALPVGIERGWISHAEGYARALTTLQTFTNGTAEGAHGFFYHFLKLSSGIRTWESELSSIDTALLVAGALVSGNYFAGTEVQTLAEQLYANVEWDWMLNGGTLLRMGWKPETGFLNAAWDHFDESLILYVLAIGSPTHPISPVAWEQWQRPVHTKDGGYIYLASEPLFVYQYPLDFLDLRGQEDPYANYWNNTAHACQRQAAFAAQAAKRYTTFAGGVWGISASDGPKGYRAYGATPTNHDGTVAPYASLACLPYTPELALTGLRALLGNYGEKVWRRYGLVSAVNADRQWYSHDHIGIDQGNILLAISNAQDGLVWQHFMANPPIQHALERMGFVPSTGSYAVTPAYLQAVTAPK